MYEEVDKLIIDAELSVLSRSNAWISAGPLRVYLRVGARFMNERMTPCIDVASVTCDDPGKGAFGRFLDHLEARYAGYVVFVENVLNERLCSYLSRRGYTLLRNAVPCYFLPQRFVRSDYGLMEARVLAYMAQQAH